MIHTDSILVVDDQETILSMYPLVLEKEGYRVLTAASGAAALDILRQEKVSLVLSDIRMPKMDGLELLDRIKEHHRNTKVIMISETDHDEDRLRTLGALHYLPKPVSVKQLVSTLNLAVRRERRKTGRFEKQMTVIAGDEHEGHTLNISSDGMLVETDRPLPGKTELSFTVTNPLTERTFSEQGMVLKATAARDTCRSAVYFARNVGRKLADCMQTGLRMGYL